MEVVMIDGKLYEVNVLVSATDEGVSLECWDMSPTGGLLFTLRRNDRGELEVQPQGRSVPFQLFLRMQGLIHEL